MESKEFKGKHIFGMVKVGERGQIVIPKEAREIFGIKAGDSLLIIGDEGLENGEKGLAIMQSSMLFDVFSQMKGEE